MNSKHRRSIVRRRAPRALAVAAAALCAGTQAQVTPQNPLIPPAVQQQQAAGGPFYIGISQTFTRDSNIFRAPSDGSVPGATDVSDTVSTTTLLGGIDAPFGRQRATAEAQISHNKFNDQDQLDHTGVRLAAGLDWETAGRLSGTLALIGQQRLARYGIEGTAPTTEENLERARQLTATVQYGGPAILALYGLFEHRAVNYTLGTADFDRLDYDRNMVGVGLRYRVGGALTVGGELRTGKGEYPNFRISDGDPATPDPETPDDFDRHEAALTAVWVPTGSSRLSARLAATKQDHDIESRDFDGATGSLLWNYDPGGKLRFETELRRDTGQELDPLRIGGVIDAVGNASRVASRIQLRGFYEATAKVRLDALVRYTRRKLEENALIGVSQVGARGDDSTTVLRLGVRWEPTRAIALGCGIGREQRDASVSGFPISGPLSYDYDVDTASCFAQFVLNP